jgi:hypothetical protein
MPPTVFLDETLRTAMLKRAEQSTALQASPGRPAGRPKPPVLPSTPLCARHPLRTPVPERGRPGIRRVGTQLSLFDSRSR